MILKPQVYVLVIGVFSIIHASDFRVIEKLLDQCSTKDEMFKCFKIQAIKVADRAVRMRNLNLFGGVSLVANTRQGRSMQFGLSLNETKLEKLDSDQLDEMLQTTTDRWVSKVVIFI